MKRKRAARRSKGKVEAEETEDTEAKEPATKKSAKVVDNSNPDPFPLLLLPDLVIVHVIK